MSNLIIDRKRKENCLFFKRRLVMIYHMINSLVNCFSYYFHEINPIMFMYCRSSKGRPQMFVQFLHNNSSHKGIKTKGKKCASQLCLFTFSVNAMTWGQFHQHFTHSFYGHRSQKCKIDSQVKQLFALLGFVCVKATCKHVDEIDPKTWSFWRLPNFCHVCFVE